MKTCSLGVTDQNYEALRKIAILNYKEIIADHLTLLLILMDSSNVGYNSNRVHYHVLKQRGDSLG